MLIQEEYVVIGNDGEPQNCLGASDLYEPFTDNVQRLFRSLQKEYGGCTSKVYVDVAGVSRQGGWCFRRRTKHEDSNATYVREVWVTLYEQKPDVAVTHHYKFLN